MIQRAVLPRLSVLASVFALAFVRAASATTPPPQIGSGIPVVENYTTKDYDFNGQVWTIAQDKQGVMYFGVAAGGVLQFDGVTWRKIFLPSNVVRSIAVDDKGKVWVGTNGNFGYLEPDAVGNSFSCMALTFA